MTISAPLSSTYLPTPLPDKNALAARTNPPGGDAPPRAAKSARAVGDASTDAGAASVRDAITARLDQGVASGRISADQASDVQAALDEIDGQSQSETPPEGDAPSATLAEEASAQASDAPAQAQKPAIEGGNAEGADKIIGAKDEKSFFEKLMEELEKKHKKKKKEEEKEKAREEAINNDHASPGGAKINYTATASAVKQTIDYLKEAFRTHLIDITV